MRYRVWVIARILLELKRALGDDRFKVNINEFNGRLALQKLVFLMQNFDADLGYLFGWYLYGPYSSGLANDAFSNFDIFAFLVAEDKAIENIDISHYKESIDNLIAFLKESKELLNDIDFYDRLEFLASLIYLIVYEEMAPEGALEELLKIKPKFDRGAIKEKKTEIIQLIMRYLRKSQNLA